MRCPAEWEPHERTLMGWPCRTSLWGPQLEAARAEYAAVANAIAAFEPVTMLANPGADAAEARSRCTAAVDVLAFALDDSWLRDTGPIYLLDPDGPDGPRRVATHWRFNAWGEKFTPYDLDATVGRRAAEALGDPVVPQDLVLEGGAVLCDGANTLISTEQCLLAPNRNPDRDRAEIEAAVLAGLAAERMVWLGLGQYEDRDTDGHVDMVAAAAPDGRVLLQTAPPEDPNHERGEENAARLRAAGLTPVPIGHLPRTTVAGAPVAVAYLNLYVANGSVIVPVCGDPFDPEALAIIAGAFPGREVVPVAAPTIAYGGGGPHCITQQVPATTTPTA